MRPCVSVVLPVYNCAAYVGQAIESILHQTFKDLELIVIDDGSTDETDSVLRRYADSRIRLVSQENLGLAAALNRGIELAAGRYVARQDADDFSYPDRLEKQVAYLDRDLECALLGTWAEIWDTNGKTDKGHRHPPSNGRLKYELLVDNPFVHSSVMIRRTALDRVGWYSVDPSRQPPEDYELWSRIARVYQVANIPEVLQVYREVTGSMSRAGVAPFLERLIAISAENIAYAAQVEPDNQHVINVASLLHGMPHGVKSKPDLRAMVDIFRRAALAVIPQHERAGFGREAERRIRDLRYAYPDLFGTGFLALKMARLAHRTALFLRG